MIEIVERLENSFNKIVRMDLNMKHAYRQNSVTPSIIFKKVFLKSSFLYIFPLAFYRILSENRASKKNLLYYHLMHEFFKSISI